MNRTALRTRLVQRLEDATAWFERWDSRRSNLSAAILVGLSAWLVSTFLYTLQHFPFHLDSLRTWGRAEDFVKMCADPLTRDLREPILAYRIVTPAICHLTGLRGLPALILPYLLAIAALGVIYHAAKRHMDGAAALLVTLGLSFTQLIIWSNSAPGVADSTTHLATAICLLSPSAFLAFMMTLVGGLNDERFMLAMPFLLIWHGLLTEAAIRRAVLMKLLAGVLLGLAGIWCVRYALTTGLIGPGIERPQVYSAIAATLAGLGSFIWGHKFWLLVNYFMAFRWLWLVLVVALLAGLDRKNAPRRLAFLALIVGVTACSTLVWDVSRSIAFAYPAVLVSAYCLYGKNQASCKHLLAATVLLCLLTPAFFLSPGGMQIFLPLPFVLLKSLAGWDILDLIRKRGSGTFGV